MLACIYAESVRNLKPSRLRTEKVTDGAAFEFRVTDILRHVKVMLKSSLLASPIRSPGRSEPCDIFLRPIQDLDLHICADCPPMCSSLQRWLRVWLGIFSCTASCSRYRFELRRGVQMHH